MKSLVWLSAIVSLCLAAIGCGGTHESNGPSSLRSSIVGRSAAASGNGLAEPYERGDDDFDSSPHHRDSDDYIARGYGYPASGPDRRAIAATVKRYLAAAVADNGAAICRLLSPRLAKAPSLGETAEHAYPIPMSAPLLHGQSCPAIMTLLFREDHARLDRENATLQVVDVRIKGAQGLAILGFATMFERELPVRREGDGWKVDDLLDQELV